MSTTLIRAAFEKAINAMTPPLATAWENSAFTPVPGTPYQRVHIMRGRPQNPTFDSYRREVGFMQIMLCYPRNAGPAASEARAELIVTTFPWRLGITEGSVTVRVDGTPHVMDGFNDDEDRWVVPVRIPFYANIP